jgi:hypothetical protein
VDGEDVEVLRLAGLRATSVPDEVLEEHTGPPISWNDLIDFHFLLESPGWEELLDRSVGR